MPYDPRLHGPRRVIGPGFHEQVYAVVQRIPRGRVASFGDVAAMLGLRRAARQVGFALAALPEDRDVPWHRVVTSTGKLSVRANGKPSPEQIARLRGEGVPVSAAGQVAGFSARRHEFHHGPMTGPEDS